MEKYIYKKTNNNMKQLKTKHIILTLFCILIITLILGYNNDIDKNIENHPKVLKTNDLNSFIKNNCDEETYAIKDHIIWYAEYNGIKSKIPFAIAWADSQCGKHLSTKYNYGNVGNNDRGDRVGFNNAFEGWVAIIDTLNNKYIGGIEKVGHLSQGGRNKMTVKNSCHGAKAPYKCYATSELNWNYNVINALTKMIGENVKENFLIRL